MNVKTIQLESDIVLFSLLVGLMDNKSLDYIPIKRYNSGKAWNRKIKANLWTNCAKLVAKYFTIITNTFLIRHNVYNFLSLLQNKCEYI